MDEKITLDREEVMNNILESGIRDLNNEKFHNSNKIKNSIKNQIYKTMTENKNNMFNDNLINSMNSSKSIYTCKPSLRFSNINSNSSLFENINFNDNRKELEDIRNKLNTLENKLFDCKISKYNYEKKNITLTKEDRKFTIDLDNTNNKNKIYINEKQTISNKYDMNFNYGKYNRFDNDNKFLYEKDNMDNKRYLKYIDNFKKSNISDYNISYKYDQNKFSINNDYLKTKKDEELEKILKKFHELEKDFVYLDYRHKKCEKEKTEQEIKIRNLEHELKKRIMNNHKNEEKKLKNKMKNSKSKKSKSVSYKIVMKKK